MSAHRIDIADEIVRPGTNVIDRSEAASNLLELAADLGIDDVTAAAAAQVVAAGKLPLLSISGRLASGKDSVALAVYERLAADGVVNMEQVEHLSFAKPLKQEMNRLLVIARAAPSAADAVIEVAAALSMPAPHVFALIDFVSNGALTAPAWKVAHKVAPKVAWRHTLARFAGQDAYSRTPGMRRALQFLGTEVRRSADDLYWVKKAQAAAIEAVGAGKACFFTDCRFPNEVEGMQVIGIPVLRLVISPETQIARLAGRDGLAPDPAALSHASEVALDDFDAFDWFVDNEQPFDEVVAEVVATITA